MASVTYHYVDPATGEILESGSSRNPSSRADLYPLAKLFTDTGNVTGDTHYYSGSPLALTERPDNPTIIDNHYISADGVEEFTLSNYPAGMNVTIVGPGINYSAELDTGLDSFSTTSEGEYDVTLELFPYRNKLYFVVANGS